LKYQAYNKLSV